LAIGGMSLTIRDSTVSGNTAGDGGGGIALVLYGPGSGMTIEDSTITGNDAGSGDGGGLGVVSFYAGGLAIRRSTLAGNIAAYGGGLFFYGYGGALIENTTISGNQATAGDGGGALVVNYYGAALRHATIAANSATGAGGGIMTCASVTLENSLVGDNTAGTDSDLATNCAGSFAVRFSLVETPGAAVINDNGGNVFNQDAQIAPLAANGGPTRTHLPAAASPVVNTADPAFTPPPATDQRGLGRVVNGRLDMGAVEVSPGTIQLTVSAATVGEAAGTVTITATRAGGADGAVSVRFDTADGTAIAPDDFTAIANNTVTLSWANQDAAAKSIQVTILNDALIEADETFQATISNPQGGAALGAITSETVTIQSEDVSVVAIPTLDEWGRLLLAGLLAAAAAVALRRRRDLAGPTLALALTVGALAQAAETAPKAGHGRRKVVQAAVEATAGEGQALRLASGQTIDLASVTLSVRDYRGPKARRAAPLPTSLADLAAFPGARIVLRTANDGTPRRVIFVIGASGASGASDAVDAVKVKTP
jgi:hypothetical protein